MGYIIRLVGLASGESSEDEARYLCVIGECRGAEGGFLSTTPDPATALSFGTPEAAFEFSYTAPVRGFNAIIEHRREVRTRSPRWERRAAPR